MGQKKAAPKKTDEEKAAEKLQKANESLFKACKDDELKKVEDAVAKGADIHWQNDKGHTAVHVAAAFGALSVIRYLHKQGAALEVLNERKMTPLMAARHIGEEDAAALLEALIAGKSGDGIGQAEDASDDEDEAALSKAKAEAAAEGKAGAGASESSTASDRKDAYPASESSASKAAAQALASERATSAGADDAVVLT